MDASYLNGGESFVVVAPGGANVWSWHGESSSQDEMTYSDKLSGILCKGTHAALKEHSETEDFWSTLGGKKEYLSFKDLGAPPDFEARLFEMRSSEQGKIWMTEVHNFS